MVSFTSTIFFNLEKGEIRVKFCIGRLFYNNFVLAELNDELHKNCNIFLIFNKLKEEPPCNILVVAASLPLLLSFSRSHLHLLLLLSRARAQAQVRLVLRIIVLLWPSQGAYIYILDITLPSFDSI